MRVPQEVAGKWKQEMFVFGVKKLKSTHSFFIIPIFHEFLKPPHICMDSKTFQTKINLHFFMNISCISVPIQNAGIAGGVFTCYSTMPEFYSLPIFPDFSFGFFYKDLLPIILHRDGQSKRLQNESSSNCSIYMIYIIYILGTKCYQVHKNVNRAGTVA